MLVEILSLLGMLILFVFACLIVGFIFMVTIFAVLALLDILFKHGV